MPQGSRACGRHPPYSLDMTGRGPPHRHRRERDDGAQQAARPARWPRYRFHWRGARHTHRSFGGSPPQPAPPRPGPPGQSRTTTPYPRPSQAAPSAATLDARSVPRSATGVPADSAFLSAEPPLPTRPQPAPSPSQYQQQERANFNQFWSLKQDTEVCPTKTFTVDTLDQTKRRRRKHGTTPQPRRERHGATYRRRKVHHGTQVQPRCTLIAWSCAGRRERVVIAPSAQRSAGHLATARQARPGQAGPGARRTPRTAKQHRPRARQAPQARRRPIASGASGCCWPVVARRRTPSGTFNYVLERTDSQ